MPDLTHLTFGPSTDSADHRHSTGVVEIPLLLPANQAAALIELSRERQQSVGQILRAIINREINDSRASIPIPGLSELHTTCRDTSAY